MKDTVQEESQYYTVAEFAEKMRVADRTVYRWVKRGVVQGLQVMKGGEYRIPKAELDRLQISNT